MGCAVYVSIVNDALLTSLIVTPVPSAFTVAESVLNALEIAEFKVTANCALVDQSA